MQPPVLIFERSYQLGVTPEERVGRTCAKAENSCGEILTIT